MDRESAASTDVVTVQPQPTQKPSLVHRYIDSFKPIQSSSEKDKDVAKVYVQGTDEEKLHGGSGATIIVDGDATVEDSKLKRRLHGRHLQMIAIGGSIVSTYSDVVISLSGQV